MSKHLVSGAFQIVLTIALVLLFIVFAGSVIGN